MNTEIKYLELLSKTFKNIAETSTEIINLQAIMNLPKGTEHFMTDIHGEYEAFNHVLRNGSGTIRNKIQEAYGNSLTENEKKELASIIYYPKEKVELMQNRDNFNTDKWMITIIYRLIEVCKVVCSKYTRSKVRKAMTKDFEYILQELLYEKKELANKKEYFDSIVDTIISIDTKAVTKLVEFGVKNGKIAKPNLKIGVCGEHGGDPKSIEFFETQKFDYVSCSPFRVPTAILAAAQSYLKMKN